MRMFCCDNNTTKFRCNQTSGHLKRKVCLQLFLSFFPKKIKFDTRVFMIVEAQRFEYVIYCRIYFQVLYNHCHVLKAYKAIVVNRR